MIRSFRLLFARHVIVVLALLIAQPAFAACALTDIVLTGVVVDADNAPVAGVAVEARWTEKQAGDMSLQRTTDARGQFQLKVQFDPYSGRSLGGRDKCEAKLDEIELSATRSGYRAVKQSVDPTKLPDPLVLTLAGDR